MTAEQIITRYYNKVLEALKDEWILNIGTQWYVGIENAFKKDQSLS